MHIKSVNLDLMVSRPHADLGSLQNLIGRVRFTRAADPVIHNGSLDPISNPDFSGGEPHV